jgi:hypothetical protein
LALAALSARPALSEAACFDFSVSFFQKKLLKK